jgi:transcriptional regulator with PAS, ATPase and Fis domain
MRLQLPHYMNLLCNTHKKDLDLFFENDFITVDENLKKEISKLAEVNLTNRNILITGPSGVGKSHLGKLIHKLSRLSGNLVHINCSEIPENLLEAELFGHTKGAFTGAEKARTGKLTSASKGILFLDEVGTMPLSMQQKLLKALDEKTFYPVGSDIPQKIDFTLITATCEDLEEKIQNKTFREDFFYRINGISIKIPSLSERKKDIELLISKFIQNSPRKFIMKEEAIEVLQSKPWPGNIRELNKFLERIHDSEIGIVRREDIDSSLGNKEREILLPDPNDILHLGLKSYIAQLEKMAVEASMKRNHGKVTECIKELRISVSAFYRILNSN